MKIKTKDRVYIQKYDAEFLIKTHEDPSFGIPDCVIAEIRGEENAQIMKANAGYSDYMFLVFKEPESKSWIMDQFYLVDYESYNKLSFQELWDLVGAKENEVYDSFNERILVWQSEIPSLNILRNTRANGLKFNFPEDYEGA